jgi:hypothetical protein
MSEYEAKMDQWISDGWLEPHNETKHGLIGGLIPLMAAHQPNKLKKNVLSLTTAS